MSTFEDDRYQWRETYFVLFDPVKKPQLQEIRKGFERMFKSLEIREAIADEQGGIESLSVASHGDFAAIDLIYQCGDHVIAETNAMSEVMLPATSPKNRKKLEKAKKHRARLDVLHFEQMEPNSHPESQEDPVFTFAALQPLATISPFASRPKFQFDKDRYIPPPEPVLLVSDEQEANDEEIDTKSFLWVRQPNQLSRKIREVKSNLEQKGLHIEIRNSGGSRQIRIRNSNL
jgi:hypothetical protein